MTMQPVKYFGRRIIRIFKAALAILARFFMAAAAEEGLPSRAHPAVCDGKLLIRNQGVLTCYSIK
jgi:hypothetical protein